LPENLVHVLESTKDDAIKLLNDLIEERGKQFWLLKKFWDNISETLKGLRNLNKENLLT